MLLSACPTMPCRDLDATIAFYARLGFRVGGRFDAEGYLIVEREGVELHFFRRPELDPKQSDHSAYLRVEDAGAWSQELAGLGLPDDGIPRFEPARLRPWGMLELNLVDEDGNLLRVGSLPAEGG